jgi:hypothetical protein
MKTTPDEPIEGDLDDDAAAGQFMDDSTRWVEHNEPAHSISERNDEAGQGSAES